MDGPLGAGLSAGQPDSSRMATLYSLVDRLAAAETALQAAVDAALALQPVCPPDADTATILALARMLGRVRLS